MKDLVIIGAGDFGRETMWYARRMNEAEPTWNILGFVDDGKVGQTIDGYPVLGGVDWLAAYPQEVYATTAIADGHVKEKIWTKLAANPNVRAGTIIDPSAIISKDSVIEEGCIFAAGTVVSVAAHVGRHCIVNIHGTVGHDVVIEDYCTVHPATNIAGFVRIGTRSLIGIGTKIIQGLSIAPDTIVGAGAVVVRSITESGTYAGVPAKRIK